LQNKIIKYSNSQLKSIFDKINLKKIMNYFDKWKIKVIKL